MNNYNENDLAIVSLCTNLGDSNALINPLTNNQYTIFAGQIYNSSLKSPKNLLDNIKDLDLYWQEFNLSFEMKNRIEYLLSPERVVKVHMGIQDLKRKNIHIITRASENYPVKLKDKLKNKRPSVIFYIGNLELIKVPSVGIVGSRNIGKEEELFINDVTLDLIYKSYTIISGGAKGADRTSEEVALNNNGNLVLFLASDMNKKITDPLIIKHIIEGKMLILSESVPSSHFKIYAAMDRNKYIYALSEFVIIAKTDYNKGGTWAGAREALKFKFSDVYLKDNKSNGFKALIDLGAYVYQENNYNIKQKSSTIKQLSLFEDNDIKSKL